MEAVQVISVVFFDKKVFIVILQKNANERNVTLLTNCRVQFIFGKDICFYSYKQVFYEKCSIFAL